MSDRSAANLTVYRATPTQLDDIQRHLAAQLGACEPIVLGEQMDWNEVRVGWLVGVATILLAIHPDVVLEGHQSGHYDQTGDWVVNSPETGYQCFQTAEGVVVLEFGPIEQVVQAAVTKILAEHASNPSDLDPDTPVYVGEEVLTGLRDAMGVTADKRMERYRNPGTPPKFNSPEEADAWLEAQLTT